MKTKTSILALTNAFLYCLLAAAASWWNGLTVFKRELYIGRHYADNTPTNDK
jgi:hypothetical protein